MEPLSRVVERIENLSLELNKLKDKAYDEYQEIHIRTRGLESSWSPVEIKNFFKELNDNFLRQKTNFIYPYSRVINFDKFSHKIGPN